MTAQSGFFQFMDREPSTDQLVALQAGDVLPVGIGMVHHAQMDAVHLIEVTVDIAAKDDLGHLVLSIDKDAISQGMSYGFEPAVMAKLNSITF